MFNSPQSEGVSCLKYFYVLKRENRLNWILNNFYLKLFFSYNRWNWDEKMNIPEKM